MEHSIALALNCNRYIYVFLSATSCRYGPSMLMFYSQTYLLPNMLGCFLMSFFIFHTGKISRISVPLFKSLTTGLCGCITTYSSWMNSSVNILFDSGWYYMLLLIFTEFLLTWSAFTMGFGAAKICSDLLKSFKRLTANNPVEQVQINVVKNSGLHNSLEIDTTGNFIPSSPDSSFAEKSPGGKVNSLKLNNADNSIVQEAAPNHQDERAWTALESTDPSNFSNGSRLPLNKKLTFDSELRASHNTHTVAAWREEGTPIRSLKTLKKIIDVQGSDQDFVNKMGSSEKDDLSPDMADELKNRLSSMQVRSKAYIVDSQHFMRSYEFFIWAILFFVVGFIMLVLVCVGSKDTTDPEGLSAGTRRDMRRSIFLAPIGAWVRWGLTRIPQLKTLWPEINPQTLVANLLAVTIMVLLLVHCQSNDWTFSINTGEITHGAFVIA